MRDEQATKLTKSCERRADIVIMRECVCVSVCAARSLVTLQSVYGTAQSTEYATPCTEACATQRPFDANSTSQYARTGRNATIATLTTVQLAAMHNTIPYATFLLQAILNHLRRLTTIESASFSALTRFTIIHSFWHSVASFTRANALLAVPASRKILAQLCIDTSPTVTATAYNCF